MINGAALRINSKPPPPQNSYQHNSIQIPMLGSLAGPNKPPPGQQQQQQQPQAPQQQQGPQTSEIQQIPQSGQDFTLSNVLHYLQTEWRRYERDRNEWEIERAEMRVSRAAARLKVCRVVAHSLSSHVPRPGSPSSRASVARSTMSSLTSCGASRCSSTLFESNGMHVLPVVRPRTTLTCRVAAPSSWHNRPRNLFPLRSWPRCSLRLRWHHRKTTRVVGAPRAVKVRLP